MKLSRNSKVFIIALLFIVIISFFGIIRPEQSGNMAAVAFSYIIQQFGWLYLISVSLFLVFCLFLFISPYRHIKLGPDDSKPDFSNLSWFAMLFSAGMAIGLIFWGVAEPMSHYINPPHQLNEAGSSQAVLTALRFSFFHWGFHAWANYALFALAIAYFQLRKGYPGLVSSIFIPLIGEKAVRGPIGMSIDILAIFATVTGIATDFGLGAMQINSGLTTLYNIPYSLTTQMIIIVVATCCFMMSAIKGLNKGIKFLSDLNIILCVLLMILVFSVGPSIEIIKNFFLGSYEYLRYIVVDSLPLNYLKTDSDWLGNWTIFYWAWWIAWTPFVGTFIARISRGRTIKEFLMGVLIFPVLGSMAWFALFGTLSTKVDLTFAKKAIQSVPTAYFDVIRLYPLSGIISLLTIVLLFVFFVTSADSSTFVLAIYSSDGDLNPPTNRKIVWGIVQALLGLSLLVAGGLDVIQTANIVAAFPFVIIMLFSMLSLYKGLKTDPSMINRTCKKEEASVTL